jgi:hypothetical protein
MGSSLPTPPNFELNDTGVGSIARCRHEPGQSPLNLPQCIGSIFYPDSAILGHFASELA